MKKSVAIMLAAAILVTASYAEAGKKTTKHRPRLFGSIKLVNLNLAPTPALAPITEPIPSVHDVDMMVTGESVELFRCVKVEDRDNIHPCAVPKIISIVDPCACDDPCSCCGPKCVYIQICVPPCGCPEVKISRKGRKVTYDYGKYSIEIKSSKRKGIVKVNYDD